MKSLLIAALNDIHYLRINIYMGCFTPNVLQMMIIVKLEPLDLILAKFIHQTWEILVCYYGIFHTSE